MPEKRLREKEPGAPYALGSSSPVTTKVGSVTVSGVEAWATVDRLLDFCGAVDGVVDSLEAAAKVIGVLGGKTAS